MWLCSLEDAPAESAGAKASALRVLAAAGLPVPPGMVLLGPAFSAVTGGVAAPVELEQLGSSLEALTLAIERADLSAALGPLEAEVSARARQLAGPDGALAVRSSVSLEDRGAGAAAGVYSSRVAVPPAEVWPAIRAVWASACTPLAAAYARRRGQDIKELAVAVIVQRHVPGQRLTVYTRQPGQPRGPLACIERAGALELVPRDLAPTAPLGAALALALRAEAALALIDGADVELIERPDGELALVQARAIVHPAHPSKVSPPPLVTAALLADGRRWVADLAHNPDPVSPAQAGLIDLVDREAASPYELRLCGGYLYTTQRASPPLELAPPSTARELRVRFAELEERAEAALGSPVEEDLAATLAAYLRLTRVWAYEMSPLVTAARRAAGPAWAARGARVSSVEARLVACARGQLDEAELVAELGELATAWDVAAPTLGETPELLRAAVARLRRHLPAPVAAEPADELAETAAELAERDDWWFARAQARVRRALLALGRKLRLGDAIFWIPLTEAVAAAAAPASFDVVAARARASAARAADRRARSWRMPEQLGGPAPAPAVRWRGVGCGGLARGRAHHVPALWQPADHGATPPFELEAIVIVTPAVTPALAVAMVGAAAIVSETGGLLDHGAALARELGIPCVVSCADALSLPHRALLEVDGDAGVVRVLQP